MTTTIMKIPKELPIDAFRIIKSYMLLPKIMYELMYDVRCHLYACSLETLKTILIDVFGLNTFMNNGVKLYIHTFSKCATISTHDRRHRLCSIIMGSLLDSHITTKVCGVLSIYFTKLVDRPPNELHRRPNQFNWTTQYNVNDVIYIEPYPNHPITTLPCRIMYPIYVKVQIIMISLCGLSVMPYRYDMDDSYSVNDTPPYLNLILRWTDELYPSTKYMYIVKSKSKINQGIRESARNGYNNIMCIYK